MSRLLPKQNINTNLCKRDRRSFHINKEAPHLLGLTPADRNLIWLKLTQLYCRLVLTGKEHRSNQLRNTARNVHTIERL
ncbi:hypothetical protein Bhyg_01485 [Pseudolycoriella hygida]|uniref:Uncharacterized protein n=1 Tax=Pseudolycoriella hygida TaxID=35572 RepID=A0A9Q0N9Q9_9DIPT|nr:hypothetical protein Bhyg_01485 [Pseudolycoriella hygida]